MNEAAVNNSGPKKGGGLFGSRNAASHDLDKEKQHKYFNRIDTTYMMDEIKKMEQENRP